MSGHHQEFQRGPLGTIAEAAESPVRILLAASPERNGEAWEARLTRLGFPEVLVATSGQETLNRAQAFEPELAVVDLRLPGRPDGLATAAELLRRHAAPVVFLGDGVDEITLDHARALEPYGWVFRPENDHELKLGLETALARLAAERRLGLLERQWAVTLQSIGDGVIAADLEGRVTFMNAMAEHMTGFGEADALGRPLTEVFRIINEFTREPAENPALKALREGRIVGLANHTVLIHREGFEIYIDDCAAPIRDETRKPVGVVLVFHDVTERRRRERELRWLNRLHATLGQINQLVVRVQEPESLLHEACEACVKHGQFPLAWVAWLDPADRTLKPRARAGKAADVVNTLAVRLPEQGIGSAGDPLVAAFVSGKPFVASEFPENPWLDASLRVGFRTVGAFPLRFGGEVAGLLVVHAREFEFFRMKEIRLLSEAAEDLSFALDHIVMEKRRREVEEALKSSEARFRQIYEQLPVPYHSLDAEGRLLDVNPAWLELFGYGREEVVGRSVADFMAPSSAERFGKLFPEFRRTGVAKGWEVEFRRKDGGTVPVLVRGVFVHDRDGQPTHTHCVLHDLTDLRLLERQQKETEMILRQQQKLEAIGTLASGVAHEINNPITGVMNYAEIINDQLPEDSPLREFVYEIIRETQRVATIVRNLLSFARRDQSSFEPTNIRDVVEGTLSLIRTIIKKDRIKLEVDVADDLPLVRCRGQQIQQVLMNLMTNARDALNEKYPEYHDDKIMRVAVRRIEREGRPWVRITVEDHGPGIPPDKQERIFEPFYTTKGRTKGTGIGLSLSMGIINEHKGLMYLESEPGQWTRFHIELEALGEEVPPEQINTDPDV
ncbi:MAG: PAS domain S-box protein [Verrucomicrobia bacterium]|nr:MAG: PAS domain S-box protein [Verrucomicrobiota bacterium]